MGKVQVIQKSRKEYRCNKCGKVIPVGSKYYRGEINFGPTIIRCVDCGLQYWEVTTSDWELRVGELLHRWEENYGVSEDTVCWCEDNIVQEIESIRDDQQESLDNMPENFQYGEIGDILQTRIDACDNCLDELYDIDLDDIKYNALEEFDIDGEYENKEFREVLRLVDNSQHQTLIEIFEDLLRDAINEALSNLEV